MSYGDTCPQIEEKRKLFGDRYVHMGDTNPTIRKKLEELYELYPINLCEIDLLAAEEFNLSFKKRNQEEKIKLAKEEQQQVQVVEPSQKLGSNNELFSRTNFLGTYWTYISRCASEYVKDVVSSCPSYFPPSNSVNHLSYWSSSQTKLKHNSFALFFNCTAKPNLISSQSLTHVRFLA